MKKVLLFLLVPMFSLTSCATIFGGGGAKQIPVSVDGPDEYEIFVNGINMGDQALISVEKGDVVTIEADGYKKSVTAIQGKFNSTSLLNLISWGLVGFIVDAVTDNLQKVTTPAITARLKAEKMK